MTYQIVKEIRGVTYDSELKQKRNVSPQIALMLTEWDFNGTDTGDQVLHRTHPLARVQR